MIRTSYEMELGIMLPQWGFGAGIDAESHYEQSKAGGGSVQLGGRLAHRALMTAESLRLHDTLCTKPSYNFIPSLLG